MQPFTGNSDVFILRNYSRVRRIKQLQSNRTSNLSRDLQLKFVRFFNCFTWNLWISLSFCAELIFSFSNFLRVPFGVSDLRRTLMNEGSLFFSNINTAAVTQSVKVFAPETEGWVFALTDLSRFVEGLSIHAYCSNACYCRLFLTRILQQKSTKRNQDWTAQ